MTALRTNLFVAALALSLFGTVMVYSATSKEQGAQLLLVRFMHLALGVAAFFAARQVRYTAWRRLAPGLYLVVLAGLVAVLVPGIGIEVGGARRWLDLGYLNLQPAEFAKLAAITLLSCTVARMRPGSGLPGRPVLAVGLLCLLVFLEPDFGTSVVIAAGAAGSLWASELKTRDLLLSGVAMLVALVGMMFLEPYRRDRFLSFLDPWSVSDGSGYQVVQSMVAIKTGSLFGAGAGGGGGTIPEVQTDMIFGLVGEEFGLLGTLAVILTFALFALAAFAVALRAPTVMGRCLAAGFATMFAVQTTFNIGAAMGAVPLAGMTLPFISYGGSSMIVCYAAVGILYRISEDGERARAAEPTRGRLPAGGGTGGHAIPALCVADELRERGAEVEFVGSESGIESTLVPNAGYPLHALPLRGLSGNLVARARAGLLFAKAFASCRRILREYRPGAVLGVGGYASAPAVLAANTVKIPTFLHEQNSVPGRANRLASFFTKNVFVTFPAAQARLRDAVFVGMPTRREFFGASREEALYQLGLEPPIVLVFGGSGGALKLNLAAEETFGGATTTYSVLHVSGRRDYDRLSTENPRYRIVAYEDEIWHSVAASSVVVMRSGAGSLFDVAATGRASVLIPYPHATGDHQLHNARYFVENDAAELLPDDEVDADTLRARVEDLLRDNARREKLATNMRNLSTPEAAGFVAERLLEEAGAGLYAKGEKA